MSQRGLEALLRPESIAVVGASNKPGRAGYLMMRNLLDSGFNGPVLPVTPAYRAVCGVLTWRDVISLPMSPDLAILCTHADRNIALLEQLGERGCKTVIVLSSQPQQFAELKACAQRFSMRLLGPNSLGILAPWQRLNASFSPVPILPGKLAFISQSAAVANTILDWAQQRAVGFSYFISLGDSLDIDVDDLLDFLARDSKTSAILLYLEHISDARRFLSASRSASRNKPILVIKSGRSVKAQQLLNSPLSLDAAYDAAIQRAGLLRVQDTHELFSAVETLSHMRPLKGERLLIISNGAAPAAMALDQLLSRNGKLAELGEETCRALSAVLPGTISALNPLDLHDDATPQLYQAVMTTLLDSTDFDALLVIHAPSAAAHGTVTASHLIEAVRKHPRGKYVTLLTNWCGEFSSQEARKLFTEAGIPTYRTPEGTVTAFMHMVEYRRNQKQLKETPALPADLEQNTDEAHRLIARTLSEGTTQLDTHEVRAILQAYGMNVLPTWIASDSAEAVNIASQVGYPVALKLRSPDIPHNSEVQGVMLYLRTASEVEQAANAIFDRARQAFPQARIQGLLVQTMANRPGSQELRVVVEQDPVFGPLIMLAEGSSNWQPERQAVVALPPLNMTLARYQVVQALKSGKIRGRNALHPLDISALSQLLVNVSNLIIDCPEIERLDIHPLLVSGSELSLLDVSMQLSTQTADAPSRLAIRPYPRELEERVVLKDGSQALFRPILPEDEPLLKAFILKVTKEDLYYRYFNEINEFTHEDLANMTQIDYDREMAFVAIHTVNDKNEIIGVTRAVSDPDNIDAEFSVLVRSDLKGLGLGRRLLDKMINYAAEHGLQRLTGITMPNNQGMITLARKLGFDVDIQIQDGIVNLSLVLKKNRITLQKTVSLSHEQAKDAHIGED
ncbi:bifunctional acetate--CoA ligase family protein/GNAT family N-acetyltransferase [Rahnella inusitata]|uniref:bifunctional acetate--CoA ligase family protein/GNAT family N-acetyltransferase n=1 Tax=Rahnella inusitata TaxID=58169 RepID=UPI0017F1ED78|nr:bifunctional acetate--CoA ligase family protein/GNAT family N-acetyltransferase [Rahnella inusitata]NMC23012.1 bifunctional acetate--CoA ligase family protein/GNAT family N-acetyltransferase [Serratia sp. (in: enterobacteria)]QUT16299.1 bifunctional acetate--CoA ligase family protein/GNAT family N-acetyltransferase [Rahnella inusitata]